MYIRKNLVAKLKTYKAHVELVHNKGVRIKKVILLEEYKAKIKDFETVLLSNYNNEKIDNDTYLKLFDKYKEIFGDFGE